MQSNPNNSKLLNPVEVAEILSISKPTVYRIIEHRELRFYKIRGSLRFKREDVEKYIEEKCVEPMIN